MAKQVKKNPPKLHIPHIGQMRRLSERVMRDVGILNASLKAFTDFQKRHEEWVRQVLDELKEKDAQFKQEMRHILGKDPE